MTCTAVPGIFVSTLTASLFFRIFFLCLRITWYVGRGSGGHPGTPTGLWLVLVGFVFLAGCTNVVPLHDFGLRTLSIAAVTP